MEQYYKIGEISQLYGIGTDTVRYYEEQGLISPMRAQNGYRMYSINDVWRMNVIRDLRALGFSVAQIGEYLQNRSLSTSLRRLQEELEAIDAKAAALVRQRSNVQKRLNALQEAQNAPIGVIRQARFARRPCYEMRQHFTTDEEMDVLIKRLLNRIPDRLYIIGNTHIGSHLSPTALSQSEYHTYDAVFIIDEEGDAAIEEGNFLTVRYRGDSHQTGVWVPKLQQYALQNGLQLCNDIIELILVDIHESADYSEHITELQARIKKNQ